MKKYLGITVVSVLLLWGMGMVLGPLLGLVGPTNNAVEIAQAQADQAEAEALTEVAQWGQKNAQNTQTLVRTLSAVVIGLLLLLGLAGWALFNQQTGFSQNRHPRMSRIPESPRNSLKAVPTPVFSLPPSHDPSLWQGHLIPRQIILEPQDELAPIHPREQN